MARIEALSNKARHQEWITLAKTALRTEMSRRKVTAAELSRLLAEIGIDEDPKVLGTKISRGTFSAAFLFQCLTAMKVQNLHISEG